MSLSDILDSVRSGAVTDGGICTRKFSQAVSPVAALIADDEATKGGICQGLVNHWIADHAAGGSLWNHLFGGDGRDGGSGINTSLLARIQLEQTAGARGEWNNGAVMQLQANERWLAVKGIIPWCHPVLQIYSRIGVGADRATAARLLAEAILTFKPSDGGYLNISLQYGADSPGGHAVAAFVGSLAKGGKREILFFDPNVGEFWFDDSAKFAKWLKLCLLKILTTQANYKYKAFQITAFAPKARGFGRKH